MTLERIVDHVGRAAENMISQYHDKANINAVLASYADQCQKAEDMMWDVADSHLLDSATGNRLDTVGKIVGQPRKGSGDDQYRLYIRARIRVNRSNGKVEDMAALMQILLEGYESHYVPLFPATVSIRASGLDLATHDAGAIAELFCAAVAGGVACEFRWSEEGSRTFKFSDTGSTVAGSTRGFGGLLGTGHGEFAAVKKG